MYLYALKWCVCVCVCVLYHSHGKYSQILHDFVTNELFLAPNKE